MPCGHRVQAQPTASGAGRETGVAVAPLLKSRDPHLAGGEKQGNMPRNTAP